MVSRALRLLGCFSLLLVAACSRDEVSLEQVRAAAAGKNLVIVLLDAANAGHFGCYGYERDTTPNLDAVAAESIVFDRGYSQASGTMLSVFSFFTSRYPMFEPETGFRDWYQVKTIPPELPSFAELLSPEFPQRLAYTSNPWMKASLGHDRGFTEYWEQWTSERQRIPDDATGVQMATRWMLDRSQERFLAYVHLMKPHGPYEAPRPYHGRFSDPPVAPFKGTHGYLRTLAGREVDAATAHDVVVLYDENLAYADGMIGEMIDRLKSAGIWDDTVFLVMSDHGQGLFEHGHPHGHGGRVVETMIHVPLFVRIPGVPARRVPSPVELVDLVPTFLDLVGRPAPDGVFAGRSLLPEFIGARDEPERWIHSRTNRRNPPIHSLRRGRYKLKAETPGVAIEGTRYSLFDLDTDPEEAIDLLQRDHPPGVAVEMRRRMFENLARGGETGAAVDSVEFDVFDPDEVERLKSLGYVE